MLSGAEDITHSDGDIQYICQEMFDFKSGMHLL